MGSNFRVGGKKTYCTNNITLLSIKKMKCVRYWYASVINDCEPFEYLMGKKDEMKVCNNRIALNDHVSIN